MVGHYDYHRLPKDERSPKELALELRESRLRLDLSRLRRREREAREIIEQGFYGLRGELAERAEAWLTEAEDA